MLGLTFFRRKKGGNFLSVNIGIVTDITKNGFPVRISRKNNKKTVEYGVLQFSEAIKILNCKKNTCQITFTLGKGKNTRPFNFSLNREELLLLKIFIKRQLKVYFDTLDQITSENLQHSYIEYLEKINNSEDNEKVNEETNKEANEETNEETNEEELVDGVDSNNEDNENNDLDNLDDIKLI